MAIVVVTVIAEEAKKMSIIQELLMVKDRSKNQQLAIKIISLVVTIAINIDSIRAAMVIIVVIASQLQYS